MRRILAGIGLVAIGAVSAYSIALWAQEPEGRVRGVKSEPGIFKSAAEVEKALIDDSRDRSPNDMRTTVFRKDDIQINYRFRGGVELAHSMHPDTEVNYITAGSGTITTGGTLPPEGSEEGITDGTVQPIKAGDWVIVPPGTAHWYSGINGELKYIQMRLGDVE